jgi:hypothetical protein
MKLFIFLSYSTIVGILSRDPLQAKQNNGYGMTNRVTQCILSTMLKYSQHSKVTRMAKQSMRTMLPMWLRFKLKSLSLSLSSRHNLVL